MLMLSNANAQIVEKGKLLEKEGEGDQFRFQGLRRHTRPAAKKRNLACLYFLSHYLEWKRA